MAIAGGTVASSVRYAGFWIRTLAYILDAILIGAIILFIPGASTLTKSGSGVHFHTNGIGILVSVGYLVLTWWLLQGTLFQRLFGLRVVPADSGSGSIGPFKAVLRYIGAIVSAIPIFLGFMWVGWDSRKQGWHDKIAGTVVIHRR